MRLVTFATDSISASQCSEEKSMFVSLRVSAGRGGVKHINASTDLTGTACKHAG
jgi:hypothetical protein